jgi:CRP/FNR family cyclic AMP-dependent transcriptional regulator
VRARIQFTPSGFMTVPGSSVGVGGLPEYIYNRCNWSGQYSMLCTMQYIWMYGVIHRIRNMKSKRKKQLFSISSYLTTMVPGSSALNLQAGQAIFCRGDAEDALYYIRRGTVKLTAVSKAGREAVIGLLRPGDFFGEGCLVGKRKHVATASAMSSTSLLVLKRKEMIRVLREEPALSDRFMLNILNRKARIEEDLVDQILNPIEKRLARALLMLASYGKDGRPKKIPKISQDELAKRIGTNRGRVNFFMNKFRKLGHIDYKGGIQINPSLLSVVLGD